MLNFDTSQYCMSLEACRANEDGHTAECEAWYAAKPKPVYVVCPSCGYEKERGKACGLPCV